MDYIYGVGVDNASRRDFSEHWQPLEMKTSVLETTIK